MIDLGDGTHECRIYNRDGTYFHSWIVKPCQAFSEWDLINDEGAWTDVRTIVRDELVGTIAGRAKDD